MTNIDNLQNGLGGTIIIATNADWRDTIQFVVDTASGTPIDITGISFYAQLRQNIDANETLLDMSTDNGLLVTVPALGELSFAVPLDEPDSGPSDHMSSLPVGTAILDIIAKADGKTKNICQASGGIQITILRGVTRE